MCTYMFHLLFGTKQNLWVSRRKTLFLKEVHQEVFQVYLPKHFGIIIRQFRQFTEQVFPNHTSLRLLLYDEFSWLSEKPVSTSIAQQVVFPVIKRAPAENADECINVENFIKQQEVFHLAPFIHSTNNLSVFMSPVKNSHSIKVT